LLLCAGARYQLQPERLRQRLFAQPDSEVDCREILICEGEYLLAVEIKLQALLRQAEAELQEAA